MKTDFYTKGVLTVIAICLVTIVIGQIDIFPKAYAETPSSNFSSNANYGLVPLNADGSIDVHIKSSSVMDVNISEVGGWATWGKVPVVIKENEDK